MLISVVIPTYRRPALLARCLEALLGQQLRQKGAYEIIVVDDANEAETKGAVEALARNTDGVVIRYLGQPVRRGPAAARNRGWRAAQSAYIAFTDDDCIPEPGWLLHGVEALQRGAPVVSGQMRVPINPFPTDYERTTALLETAEFVTANCFCRRSVLEEVGGLEEDFDIAWREDSDLQFKLLRCGIPITKQPEAVILHPVRPAPWWASLKEERKNRYDALLYKRHPRLFRERIPTYAGLVRLYYATVISILVGVLALLAGAEAVAAVAGVVWLAAVLVLVIRRLRGTSRSLPHVVQAVVISLVTPFLSVYWRLYGAVKYRVLYV